MLIARYKYSGGWFQGVAELFGCDTFNSYPSTYPPTLQYEPLIYNDDPNVYATHEQTGVRFYNSAVFKDSTNNRTYIILVTNPTMYYYGHQYAEGIVNDYNSRSGTNRIYNDYTMGYAQSMTLSSSDNFASFESDLPIFDNYQDYYDYVTNLQSPPIQTYTSNGGGATHIAKRTGQLKDLSSHISDILIVSGGGGGGMLIGNTAYPGADAGGIAGNSDNSADQSTGYAFGQGENG